MRFKGYLVLLCVLFAATAAYAQTSASLVGRATLDGNPLPGVTVVISSPNMQGTRTDVTDVNGNYNFGGIPPGTYTVRFEMESMQSVTRTTSVGVGQTARADGNLRLTAVAESITVTAAAPAVLETTEIQTNFQATLIEDLPIPRTLAGTVLLAPGVNNNGPNAGTSITISGAPAFDSVFMVNGAVINENLRGQAHNLFIEDAIQETTILVGAISAEYGRFTGGVVNAITKSGGNEFHGSLRDSMTSDEWTEVNDDFYEVRGGTAPERSDVLNQVYEATLGGRVIRDRLWFFGAARREERSGTRNLVTSPAPGSTTGPGYGFTNENERYEGKLTGQVTPRHTLVGSYLDITAPETNNCFIGCLEFINLDVARDLPNSFVSGQYNGIWTNSFLVEGNISRKKFTFKGSGGDFLDRTNGTAWYDGAATGLFFGAPVFCGVCDDERRDNDLWSAKATYFLSTTSLGTHTIVGGIENWAEERFSNNHQSGSDYFLVVVGAPPVCRNGVCFPTFQEGDIIQYSPIAQLSQGSDFQTQSGFINDKFDLNRNFSFNLGLRYDKNDGKDSGGNTVSKDSNISPRLGVIFDPRGDGRYRFNASYSKYVSKIAETVGGGGTAAGVPASIYYEYRGPIINANNTLTTPQTAAEIFKWFDENGGLDNSDLIVFARIPGLNLVLGDELVSPNVVEYTAGFGGQIGANGFARLDVMRRDWKDFYAQFRTQELGLVEDEFGNQFDLGVIGNSDFFEREYTGVTLQGAYRALQRLNLGANYTWSELRGNVTAETSGSGPIQEALFSYNEYKNFEQNNPIGYLGSDARHKVRAWASWDQPTPIGNFNISVLQRFDSGTPYSAIGTIDTRFNATTCPTCPNPANTTYVTDPTNVAYYFSDRGAFRNDDLNATDLAVNYELPIFRLALFAQAELINVFNEQAVIGNTTVDTSILTHRQAACVQTVGANAGSRCARFDPFTTVPQQGVHWQFGPNFGKPSVATTGSNANGSYNLPRTYRFSLGLRF